MYLKLIVELTFRPEGPSMRNDREVFKGILQLDGRWKQEIADKT